MPRTDSDRRNHREILEELKTCFAPPVSNPIMDGYVVHTISHFLDRIDDLKSDAPILGVGRESSYHEGQAERFPECSQTVEQVTRLLVDYCEGMTIWAHPNAQVNVVPPPTIPSVTAFVAGAMYNPNIIWDEYSSRFAEAEVQVVALLSDLLGYDPRRSGGCFTFGGTGTILYAGRIGVEKATLGTAMRDGVRGDLKIIASDVSHYSRLNVAGWLGLGTKNVVPVPTTRNNEISLKHLETTLRELAEAGERIACIVATCGTTDAFGIDDIAAVVRLRDRLVEEYGLDYRPHVHADAVIGWAWAVFRDYDFQDNALGFHARTIRSLEDSLSRLGDLHLADSVGIDLHKTGYAPYISSLILVKDRDDLGLLSREPDAMPYLYQFGHYHPGIYTLECSRAGTSALAALANIRLFGKRGYRTLIGHVVEMAEMLRERLEHFPFAQVVNDYNYGPVTLFRVYPDGLDPAATFQRELKDPDYRADTERHNAYNRAVFGLTHERAMQGEGVLLSWTDAYRHATYDGGPPIAAMKSFIMSPWTDLRAVELVAQQVAEARGQVR